MTLKALTLSIVAASTTAFAVPNYFQGFESDTTGWSSGGGITQVASNGGTLAIPSSSGGNHAEISNALNAYSAGYGNGGFSFYGGSDPAYNGAFYQSIDVYIDASWAASNGFWIDMTPHLVNPANYGAEHNFRIKPTGSDVQVRVDGQVSPIASITTDGWYTFKMTWSQAPNLSDPVLTDLEIIDAANSVLGSTQVPATSPGGPLPSSDLRGNGYVWITVWQNGAAGDVLAIDNLQTGYVATPEISATLGLLGLAFAGLAAFQRRNR